MLNKWHLRALNGHNLKSLSIILLLPKVLGHFDLRISVGSQLEIFVKINFYVYLLSEVSLVMGNCVNKKEIFDPGAVLDR